MIHIVFNESEVALMQEVIALDETLAGDVLQIKDDFAVGPVAGLDTDEGWQERIRWWRNRWEQSSYTGNQFPEFDDRETVRMIRERLAADSALQAWIWMGQNQHDVTGYFWLIPQLREWAGRIMVLYMNNLPFINEKGQIFYPSWLHEIQPKEFLKAKKLARPVTLSEFEVDPDEWKRLSEENGSVRMLEGGKKIVSRDEDFYDQDIVRNLTTEWQKPGRVITNTLNRMKVKTGDVFLMARLKQLIADGKIDVTGDVQKGWKDFDVRLPGVKGKEEAVSESTAG